MPALVNSSVGIVAGHQRAGGHDRVAAGGEEIEEILADLGTAFHGWRHRHVKEGGSEALPPRPKMRAAAGAINRIRSRLGYQTASIEGDRPRPGALHGGEGGLLLEAAPQQEIHGLAPQVGSRRSLPA
jgi:hypothetical protein